MYTRRGDTLSDELSSEVRSASCHYYLTLRSQSLSRTIFFGFDNAYCRKMALENLKFDESFFLKIVQKIINI
jgi:hypothetical protein